MKKPKLRPLNPLRMSFFTKLAKWKLRWALVTGAVTLIVIPIVRLVFKSKPAAKVSKDHKDVIDVKAEEIVKKPQS